MQFFQFKGLYQNTHWLSPAYVGVDAQGNITYLSENQPDSKMSIEKIEGYALPTFINAHSHAFQYAMAGIAENHIGKAKPDDFWAWREAMYHLALTVNPEQMEAIAAMLFAEMLRHGYDSVVEFHYLHHDKNGESYTNKAEMGERLLAAAQKAGIQITLIPIFYQKGGFGVAPSAGQKRFISPNLDSFLQLRDSTQKIVEKYNDATLGAGFHSLRAIDLNLIQDFISLTQADKVLHLHIAEQKKEVSTCKKFTGSRPVEFLCNQIALNDRFHLVHATHLTKSETIALASSGANVVLCPSTEGNLGDGFFPIDVFQKAGGHWSIGTDSHIGLNPFEEFRLADYRQRLLSHKRNTYYSIENGNSGHYALNQAIFTGRKASGNYNTKDYFEMGKSFNSLVIDAQKPLIACTSLENLISTIVYASDTSWNLGTIIKGKWLVKNQVHTRYDEILQAFRKAILELKNR